MESRVEVLIQRLDESVPLPSYAHPGDAGADLVSTQDVVLEPGQRCAVATGIALALPAGFVGLIHPRSGLALKHGISMVNAPGTIDAGYRGEIKVILINHDDSRAFEIRKGDRIAQLIIQRCERANFHEVTNLPGSDRGEGGFGSTGTSSDSLA